MKAIHVYATNALPNFQGGVDAGVERRILVVPFNLTISKEDRVPDIAQKIILKKPASLSARPFLPGPTFTKKDNSQSPMTVRTLPNRGSKRPTQSENTTRKEV